jgi:hypothetical protein
MITKTNSLLLALAAGSLLVLGATGCARHETPVSDLAQARQAPPAPASEHIAGKRFVLTETGQRYYVDSRGMQHTIVREVTEPSGVGGVFYYIEDDDRPYYVDQSERLYYRDSSGRMYYIEDARPGRSSESQVILRADRPAMVETFSPALSRETCSSQWESCMEGCKGISPKQTYDRPNCIRYCDQIRNNCTDRR